MFGGLGGCAEDLDPGMAWGEPPLRDPDLARCEVTEEVRVTGFVVASSVRTYDAEGRRTRIAFDDLADGVIDRVHRDTWRGGDLVRIEGESEVDPSYRWSEVRSYREGILWTIRVTSDVPGPADRVRTDLLSRYVYERGLLMAVDEDDAADGTVERRNRFTWAEDFLSHVEEREGVRFHRTFDGFGRVVTQDTETFVPAGVPEQAAAFVYDGAHPSWPVMLVVDSDGEGSLDVEVDWSYRCP